MRVAWTRCRRGMRVEVHPLPQNELSNSRSFADAKRDLARQGHGSALTHSEVYNPRLKCSSLPVWNTKPTIGYHNPHLWYALTSDKKCGKVKWRWTFRESCPGKGPENCILKNGSWTMTMIKGKLFHGTIFSVVELLYGREKGVNLVNQNLLLY